MGGFPPIFIVIEVGAARDQERLSGRSRRGHRGL